MTKQEEFQYIMDFVGESDFAAGEVFCEQLRSLWTAYCLRHGLDCDTTEYDKAIRSIWEKIINDNIPHPWSNFDRFDLVMGKFLC